MIRWINLWIIRFKAGVSAFYNAWVVSEPDRNLVEAAAGACEKTRECVAHGMRSNPFETAELYMRLERSSEIVTITVFSVSYGRLQHKWFTKAIAIEKRFEAVRKGNGAFLSIFEIHSGGLAEMQEPSAKVKPKWPRFDDLVLS